MARTPKQLQQWFPFVMLMLFGLLIASCEGDEALIEENLATHNKELPTVVTTTYKEAGEKFRQLSDQYNLDSHIALEPHSGIQKRGNGPGIVIISEVVKEIKLGDYTSYTMLIEPKDLSGNIFYNLTIEDVKGVTKMFITK